ncbi:hypothetical protein BDN70DRAFT_894758 [Pholiota conissans]|uniref:Uncharacterized protein n=1 Tax=Pholiota conissans TaxID=109636 RepID=A0A9P6D1G0_9AGAR|nr:hypothetical protein BDN70DRAFT_894758 [Pholiota conissans]
MREESSINSCPRVVASGPTEITGLMKIRVESGHRNLRRGRERGMRRRKGASKRVHGVSEGKDAAGAETRRTKAALRGSGGAVKKAAPTRRSKKGEEKENVLPTKTD